MARARDDNDGQWSIIEQQGICGGKYAHHVAFDEVEP